MTNRMYRIGECVVLKRTLKINMAYDGLIYFQETDDELGREPFLIINGLKNRAYTVRDYDWMINDEMIEGRVGEVEE